MSERYTHGHHASVLASHAGRTAADSAAYLLPHLRPGMSLLDVGCGPGTITLDLAAALDDGTGDDGTGNGEAGGSGRVVGVDSAPAAIEAARAEAAQRAQECVRFEVADVGALPYEDGAFDVVHAHQVLHHLPDPVAALREMARVTAPGGLVAARECDYGSMRWWPTSSGLDRWMELYQELSAGNRAHSDAGRRLRSWALAAELTDVTATASVWCYATAEATAWWGESWSHRAVESSFAGQALERGLADADELASIARAWRDWGSDPGAWFTMTHGEILARP